MKDRSPFSAFFRVATLHWLLLLPACGMDVDGSLSGESPGAIESPAKSAISCPSGTLLTYENFGQAFIEQYCTTCHSRALEETERAGAPLHANFDQKDDVAVWRRLIYKSMFEKPVNMPPQATVPSDELTLVKEWLRCGAP